MFIILRYICNDTFRAYDPIVVSSRIIRSPVHVINKDIQFFKTYIKKSGSLYDPTQSGFAFYVDKEVFFAARAL